MIVALLTDFGLSDSYVGIMKSVIAGIAPGTTLIDLSHDIPPQGVRAGAFALGAAWPYLPAGTVICAVVDPGVGSERRALAIEVDRGDSLLRLVCPDNGLGSAIFEGGTVSGAVTLDRPEFHLPRASATFHGRDLFAPVAAHLAAGRSLNEVGQPLAVSTLIRLTWPQPRPDGDGWRAEIVHVDHFGNLITNLTQLQLGSGQRWTVRLPDGFNAPLALTFAAVESGQAVAYWGSSRFLEVAVRNGSAGDVFDLGVGDSLKVEPDEVGS